MSRLYDRLSMIPGPSQQSRTRARKRGWAPPLAWDEKTIDNPTAKPYNGRRDQSPNLIDPVTIDRLMCGQPTTSTRAERREATRLMTAAGKSAAEIAEQFGCSGRNVVRLRGDLAVLEATG